jgi:hypothetical protein
VRRLLLSIAAAALALAPALALPAPALAHGLVGRADLPIPRWLFGWAAAVVLAASFAALAVLWPKPRLQEPRLRRVGRVPRGVDAACGAIGVLLFAVVVYSGLAGSQTATANLIPTFVYVVFWVGLVVASVLLGDIFRVFSPWRAVARAVAGTANRLTRGGLPPALDYPRRLGNWPAVVGIVAFVWLELIYVNRDDPSTLAVLALAYAGVQLVGMSVYGIEPWTARADALGVYFGLFARLSPWERREGVLYLRPPLSGTTRLPLMAGTVALLCTAIGSTTFDGLSQGPIWRAVVPSIQGTFGDLGLGQNAAFELAMSVGLVACVLIVGGLYRLGVRGMATVGEGHSSRELATSFAHTLIPIAFAYALAHYFSLLAYQGQAVAYLASDPLGNGSNLLGTAAGTIDYNVIHATGIWYVQVAALICGHVAGLTLAHDRAIAVYPRAREAIRSQYWMLLVMVGFTSLGLWLLSALNP